MQPSLSLIIPLFHSTTSYPTTLSGVTCATSGSFVLLLDLLLGSLPEICLQGSPDPSCGFGGSSLAKSILVHPTPFQTGHPAAAPLWSP